MKAIQVIARDTLRIPAGHEAEDYNDMINGWREQYPDVTVYRDDPGGDFGLDTFERGCLGGLTGWGEWTRCICVKGWDAEKQEGTHRLYFIAEE